MGILRFVLGSKQGLRLHRSVERHRELFPSMVDDEGQMTGFVGLVISTSRDKCQKPVLRCSMRIKLEGSRRRWLARWDPVDLEAHALEQYVGDDHMQERNHGYPYQK